LVNDVLNSLNENTQNNDNYKDIDIWFSEVFEVYLNAYGIKDIESMVK